MSEHYVYLYRDENGVPIYVGIGKGRRWREHLTRSHNKRLHNKIKKAQRTGTSIVCEKTATGMSHIEAQTEEIRLITLYGRADLCTGSLFNRTPGGEGGYLHSEAALRRMSDARVGRKSAPETGAKISATLKLRGIKPGAKAIELSKASRIGKSPSAETRLKMAKAHENRPPKSAETRAKLSASNKGRVHSQETRDKLSVARRGSSCSDETRAKIAASSRGRHVSPETRAKISAAQKGRPGKSASLETKAKMSAARKGIKPSAKSVEMLIQRNVGRVRTPEERAKISAANTGRKHTSDSKAKMSVAHKGRSLSESHMAAIAISNRNPDKCARSAAKLRGCKRPPRTPEHCAKISAAKTGRPGTSRVQTAETRAKISLAARVRHAARTDQHETHSQHNEGS